MKPRLLLRLYPRAWRERYGDEIAELLGSERISARLLIDLFRAIVDARLHPELVAPTTFVAATGNATVLLSRNVKALRGLTIAVALVAAGVVLAYVMRPPPVLASGQPDSFTVGTAILLVGYFLLPVLALLVALLLAVALPLFVAHFSESRRSPSDGEPVAGSPPVGQDPIVGPPGSQRPDRGWVTPALMILVGSGLLGVFYLGLTRLRAGDSMHIEVTPYSTAYAFLAGLVIAAGLVVVLRLREPAVAARFGIAIGGLVFGVLALFSIGILILPVALVVLGFGIRQLARRRSGQAVRAAIAGAVIGVGAIAYLLVLIQPASAECRANGGGATSSGGLFAPIAHSQGGFSSADGVSSGYIDEGETIAYFTCENGKLTDFHRERLPLGQWVVTVQPAPTVGRPVMVVFRLRPAGGGDFGASDGFDFSVTCRSCPEPRPVIRSHADRLGVRDPALVGPSVTFGGQVTFPVAGSWFTSPYEQALEVR